MVIWRFAQIARGHSFDVADFIISVRPQGHTPAGVEEAQNAADN